MERSREGRFNEGRLISSPGSAIIGLIPGSTLFNWGKQTHERGGGGIFAHPVRSMAASQGTFRSSVKVARTLRVRGEGFDRQFPLAVTTSPRILADIGRYFACAWRCSTASYVTVQSRSSRRIPLNERTALAAAVLHCLLTPRSAGADFEWHLQTPISAPSLLGGADLLPSSQGRPPLGTETEGAEGSHVFRSGAMSGR